MVKYPVLYCLPAGTQYTFANVYISYNGPEGFHQIHDRKQPFLKDRYGEIFLADYIPSPVLAAWDLFEFTFLLSILHVPTGSSRTAIDKVIQDLTRIWACHDDVITFENTEED